jgi:signal transduction histidine kinase
MEETLKILIVDDEVDRVAVRQALIGAVVQIELSEIADGNSVIAALTETSFDCVFLGDRLRDTDTLTLIQNIRSHNIRVPIIILINQGNEHLGIKLLEAGATDYLIKNDVSLKTLNQALRYSIRVQRTETQLLLANRQLRESNELLTRKNQELEAQRQQIQLQNIQLFEASQLKSKFLATISHELRTPLSIIIGFSQVLLRPRVEELAPKQRDMVERILNNGKHLLMLLNEILDFSKLEADKLELKPEIFDLPKMVNAAVAELDYLAKEKNLSIEVNIDLENPTVFNDLLRLRQIVINLLSNAIKFTEVGNVILEIREVSANKIAIAVKDTGIGIASEDLKYIFEAFRQADQTITRRYPGTGLGLAISQSLIQMMGGFLSVESQLGVGSTFKIEFPRQIASPKLTKVGNVTKPKVLNSFQKSR